MAVTRRYLMIRIGSVESKEIYIPRSSESRIRLPIFVPSALLNNIYRISNVNSIDVSYDRILWIEEFL